MSRRPPPPLQYVPLPLQDCQHVSGVVNVQVADAVALENTVDHQAVRV